MNRIGGAILTGVVCAALAACGGSGGSGNSGPVELVLSATFESFVGTQGSATNPPPAMVNVTSKGSGALMFTATSDSPWLMVSQASGLVPGTLMISAVVGALGVSNNTGHVMVTATGAENSPLMITVTFLVAPVPASTPFWGQWGANPQHNGMVNVAGQSVTNKLADVVYDPFINQEKAENAPLYNGEAVLTVHEQAPITDGDDVYMVAKTGSYNSCSPAGAWTSGKACGPNTWNTMWWNEIRYSWVSGQLLQVWDFESDWVPEPNATVSFQTGQVGLEGWEPVFHPVDTPNFIYVPGAAGAVWKLNKTTGAAASHITPFSNVNGVTAANTFVSSPLTADSSGNIYYNVIELNLTGGDPWTTNDVVNSWLVKITPTDTFTTATYASLLPGAPAGSSLSCPGTFFNAVPVPPFPWPPSTGSIAPTFPAPCGSQRPGANIAPVVAPNGTIYTASRAHFDSLVSYVVAVNPDLTPKWQASLQNLLNDGCNVLVPYGPTAAVTSNYCTMGALQGVDPTTNAMGSGYYVDEASSSPVALPDSSVLMGALDNYNFGRGHLFHFDSTGKFVNTFNFGWDSTPAVYVHGGTFSVVIKDNHYDASSYCSDPNNPICDARPPGPYYITQMDASLNIEWQFQSTNIQMPNNPNGFEWCINMPAVDVNGNVYVNSEDGNIYLLPQPAVIPPNKIITVPGGKLFLNLALGAAYTPLSIGPDGTLYTQNNGHLFAVGTTAP